MTPYTNYEKCRTRVKEFSQSLAYLVVELNYNSDHMNRPLAFSQQGYECIWNDRNASHVLNTYYEPDTELSFISVYYHAELLQQLIAIFSPY